MKGSKVDGKEANCITACQKRLWKGLKRKACQKLRIISVYAKSKLAGS